MGVERIGASIIAIATVLFACVIGAGGAVFLKLEAHKVSFRKLKLTPPLVFGVGLYGISTVLFILALRGNQLSVIYPLVSTTYAWIAVFSFFFLKEKINAYKITGILLIFAGVSVIGAFR
ncbi:MAG: multidrug transporter [Nanoarchaeota archaeon]|nr:MAG: multidrug transporter [Nanoarchaeota archaeon]